MIESIVALVGDQIGDALRRVAGKAAFVGIAAAFVLFAVAALFAALFFWLEPAHGAIAAALFCAAVAFVLAVVSALPLLFQARRPPPPPADGAAPQLLTLMARSVSNLTPRQAILTAAVVSVALFLSARRDPGK